MKGSSDRLPDTKKIEVMNKLNEDIEIKHIAKNTGLTIKQVERIRQTRNKELIEGQAQKYIDELPDVIQHDIEEIKDFYEISKKLREALKDNRNIDNLRELQVFCVYVDKKITDIKRSIGLYSSNQPGIVFQQLNVFNSQDTELSPIIAQLLGQNQNNDDDIIDIEAEDDEKSS